jgi:hypothetical protein
MNLNHHWGYARTTGFLAITFAVALSASAAFAQVSPSEILNPDLKALEETYFQQLKTVNQSISKATFPFSFYLSRFVGLDPAKQTEADSRGLEFVRFRDRVLLKVTGNYNAAYDTLRLTQNERAAKTFSAVILPILNLVASGVPEDVACDGIGFEVSYHTRTKERSYDYEGKEILVVVLDRDDAWALSRATTDAARQDIVNRSKVFVNGTELGLSLAERDPLNVQALPRSIPAKPDATSTARSSALLSRSAFKSLSLSPASSGPPPVSDAVSAGSNAPVPEPKAEEPPPAPPQLTQADADRFDEKYHTQLAALAKTGVAKFHLVDYAPPAFVIFHNQLALQMTLRNSLEFAPARGSIYKRAAQSFDLFLALQMKDLSEQLPANIEFSLFDFAVLNKLAPGPKGASEAVEFICPRAALRQFVNAEITNQQLLDQSIILVNGVRIALNLQLVE